MMLSFELLLTLLVILSGGVLIVSKLWTIKASHRSRWINTLLTKSREYFPILLAVLLIRSFLFQPFKVISGSLEPSVEIGDFLLVSQFSYGLRLPVVHWKVLNIAEPKVGDIALFYYPLDKSKVYVKRVIGLPGDHIVYKNKQLTINGRLIKQQEAGSGLDIEPGLMPVPVNKKLEFLGNTTHSIYINPRVPDWQNIDVVVPSGMYFMMGDNRDDSEDSRMWGFVPEQNLIGKALRVVLSWDSLSSSMRWGRSGLSLTS